MTPIPNLMTKRLSLRGFTIDDAESLFAILNEEGCLRYFPNPAAPSFERVQKIIESQIKHWDEHQLGWWAVISRKTGDLIGWNGLQYLPETGEVEVGYLLSAAYRGKGLASEGAQAALDFGVKRHHLNRIIGLVHPENIPSQHVLEKIGLTYLDQAQYFGMDLLRYEKIFSETG